MTKPEATPRKQRAAETNGPTADEKRLEQRKKLREFAAEGARKHARTLDELAK